MKILDSTLREGRQSLYFNEIFQLQEAYLEILTKIGITDIEYRNPFISDQELSSYKHLIKKFPKINFYTHFFLNQKNVEIITENPSIKHVSTFLNSPVTKTSIELLEQLLRNTEDRFIRVGIEDAFSLSNKELSKIMSVLNSYTNVVRIGLSDTLGTLLPGATGEFLRRFRKINIRNKSIELHFHNDYGLAGANAFEVLTNIKKSDDVYFSVSMDGIGERNGILSYGDLISNILRFKTDHGLNLHFYGDLVRLWEEKQILFNRNPLSQNNFSHFASSHIISKLESSK